jgi:hypothetical protein
MEMETNTDTSAILLLSPPLAKAAAVFYTAAAYFKQLFFMIRSVLERIFLFLYGEKHNK